MSQSPTHRPGSPAASHMIWFFVLPILGLIGFATWKLSNALLNPEVLTLEARLGRLESAINSGERWKEAYGVSQEIHKKKKAGEWDKLAAEEKAAVYKTFEKVLVLNESDSRVAQYLLVTLGQLGEKESIVILEKFHRAKDPEILFFSVWGYSQAVIASNAWDMVSDETSNRLVGLLQNSDSELKKIICAFLAQGPLKRSSEKEAILKLLDSEQVDLRLNAALALLNKDIEKDKVESVILEMLKLESLRKANFQNFADLKQALIAAKSAAVAAKSSKILARMKAFSEEVNPGNPEGRTVKEALSGL